MAAAYRKAIVAGIGVSSIVLAQLGLGLGVELQDGLVALVDGVLGVLTAYGVFRVSNEAQPSN